MVSDILDKPLEFARSIGASHTINVASDPEALLPEEAHKGQFDVIFEAAGQASTIAAALKLVRPKGTVVLLGQGAVATLPVTTVVTKEIMLRAAFASHRSLRRRRN